MAIVFNYSQFNEILGDSPQNLCTRLCKDVRMGAGHTGPGSRAGRRLHALGFAAAAVFRVPDASNAGVVNRADCTRVLVRGRGLMTLRPGTDDIAVWGLMIPRSGD